MIYKKNYAYMIFSIAEVEPEPKIKKVAGELHVNIPLLLVLSVAPNHSAEWSQTIDLTGGGSTKLLRLINTK